jgi:hypothetical protein
MNYLISKIAPDTRHSTCGFLILDNFFKVVQLTFENQDSLKNIKAIANYRVTGTDLPEGDYAPNGCRATEGSIWDHLLHKKQLEYIDKVPEGAAVEFAAPSKEQRPPNMSDRPEYLGLDQLGDVSDEDLPEAVRLARERVSGKSVPVAPVAHKVESIIPTEADSVTLGGDDIAMLRAQCDVRGIKYHPTAGVQALKKKLA